MNSQTTLRKASARLVLAGIAIASVVLVGLSIASLARARSVLAMALVLTGALGGCTLAPVEPWQRGNLAKRSMQFDSDPADDRFTQHIYSSKENSSGGYGVGGGGCGCN